MSNPWVVLAVTLVVLAFTAGVMVGKWLMREQGLIWLERDEATCKCPAFRPDEDAKILRSFVIDPACRVHVDPVTTSKS